MIRFGVIGTNWITDRFLQDTKTLPEFSLTAVYSRTEEKAKQFAGKYKVDRIFTDLEKMAESEHIDAVYIASPNAFHAEQAILFMKKGKHVLCEKPLASNVAEVDAMMAVAKEHHVVLMEAMKTTLLPGFKSIQKNLHKIGKVRRYFASFCKYSSRYDAYKEGTVLNAFRPEFSNGSLMDLGVYCLYPLVVLFGEPKSVQATATFLESGVDGQGSLLLTYDTFEAVIMHSKISDSQVSSEIQGEKGTIVIDNISTPKKVELMYRDVTVEALTTDSTETSMYYEAEEFIHVIKSGQQQSKVNSFQHSRITATLLETARKQIGLVYPSDQ
ncbi:putative dehydrogenase [Pullulanibacillus pueri]|uniref:Putative oxidoreductase YulF n=1 Tax=Pullulanibacillus pueri TaxID=1437324 RepID=A0A8J3ENM5_9BACL|nr:Gfo/Idh/MocA family oxidoreductase [Pullulanibacillus pueri]MBM7684049.1 putative dehydrogenase [Pullulanibacillus pueri]GGH88459.1 putative oxidoreductase YulF [Pullulanibacillus pueri]